MDWVLGQRKTDFKDMQEIYKWYQEQCKGVFVRDIIKPMCENLLPLFAGSHLLSNPSYTFKGPMGCKSAVSISFISEAKNKSYNVVFTLGNLNSSIDNKGSLYCYKSEEETYIAEGLKTPNSFKELFELIVDLNTKK